MQRMVESRRCYIHVGLPKSGTSYLQSVLRQSEEALAAPSRSAMSDGVAVLF